MDIYKDRFITGNDICKLCGSRHPTTFNCQTVTINLCNIESNDTSKSVLDACLAERCDILELENISLKRYRLSQDCRFSLEDNDSRRMMDKGSYCASDNKCVRCTHNAEVDRLTNLIDLISDMYNDSKKHTLSQLDARSPNVSPSIVPDTPSVTSGTIVLNTDGWR